MNKTLTFTNTTKKEANKCHDYLLNQGVNVILFEHDRQYGILGNIEREATEFYITVPNEQEELCKEKFEEFELVQYQ